MPKKAGTIKDVKAKQKKISKQIKKDNIKNVSDTYKSKKKKILVSKALGQSVDVKSTKNYVAYNPDTKTMISGNISKIAKALKTSPQTIKNRFEKKDFNKFKDHQIYRFNDDIASVDFRREIVKEDKDSAKPPKKKKVKNEPSYEIISDATAKFKHKNKFGLKKNHFSLKFKDGLDVDDIDMMILELLDKVVRKEKLDEDDWISVIIVDENLDMSKGGSVSTPLMKLSDFTPSILFSLMEKISTSDEDWSMTDATTFVIQSVKNYVGSGNKDGYEGDLDNYAAFKKCIITIKNDDEICMARAIVVGLSMLIDKPQAIPPNKSIDRPSNEHHKRWEVIRKGGGLQKEEALELHAEADVPIGPCGLTEAYKFAEYIKFHYGYQLNIFDLCGKRIIFPDVTDDDYEPVNKDENIYLLYNNQIKHYDFINNNQISGFLEKSQFCHYCKSYYRRELEHKCKFKCSVCCLKDCDSIQYFIDCGKSKKRPEFPHECDNCCRFFATKCCYDNHKKETYKKNGDVVKSVCKRIWKCYQCKLTIVDDAINRKETHICGEYNCQNCKQDVMPDHKCYMMPKLIKPPSEDYIFFDFEADISGEFHEVMYSVSAYFDDPPEDYVIHYNLEQFCKWLFVDEHKDFTVIAHNGKGYDFQFILKWCIENIADVKCPTIIKAGSKIMMMNIPKFNISFVDSMNFIAGALAGFPDIFGIKELKKGYFPHWFNTKSNWDYEGPVPPYDSFRPWNMKDEKKIDFDKWWCFKQLSNYKWNQKDEMKAYCISDVNILQRGMLKFRELFLKIANIDPLRYITIASVCMTIYRHYYIDKSFPERAIVYEDTLKYEKSADIKKHIKEEFQKETNAVVFKDKLFGCYSYELIKKIRPAFFGGRTNAVKLLYHFKKNEEGRYADVTSLYPTVQFYDEYPIGHPDLLDAQYINGNYKKVIKNIKNKKYFGFINCSVDCPKQLYHPVLAHKGEKLIFDLKSKDGTWSTNELYKAIDKGYTITHIKEIIHFPHTSKELFKEYVSKFLKIKEEASGYPDHIEKHRGKVSDELFDEMCEKHITEYFDRMGILLEKENIIYNAGMRAIAKLCLNSLWGKFGQRTNLGKSVIINTKEELFKILHNPKNAEIKPFQLTDDVLEVSYEIKEQFIPNDFTTNIAIAAFTTSSARLRLYEGLEYLNRQVLYFDTDSIVYKYNKNDKLCNKELILGDYLGEWTDECDGFKMCGTFGSGGPKNYTYRLDGKTIKGFRWCNKKKDVVKFKESNYDDYNYVIKVKGLGLHFAAKKAVNYHKVIKSINDKYNNLENTLIPIHYDMIKRDKFCNLINQMMVKNYQVVYTKRKIQYTDKYGTIDTLPFGYEKLDD